MPRSSRAGRNVALPLFALLTGLVVLSTAAPAAAHDQLLSTEPADGSTVDTVPEKVVLTFSDDLLDLSQEVVVAAPDGSTLDGLDVTVTGPELAARLPSGLGAGAYTVTWRAVSSDGHPIQGRFGFTVADEASDAASTPPDEASATPSANLDEAATAPSAEVGDPSATSSAEAGDPTPAAQPAEPLPSGSSGRSWAWAAAAGLLAAGLITLLVVRRRRHP